MSESERGAGHAFISYVRDDAAHVDGLQQILEAAAIPVWRDTENLWPGQDWHAKVRDAITGDALVFLACFSQASVGRAKSYQNEELNLAIEQLRLRRPDNPWLIPVRFDDCQIPDLTIGGGRTLVSIQRADLFGDSYHANAERLVKVIWRILGREVAAPTGPASADRAGSEAGNRRRPLFSRRRVLTLAGTAAAVGLATAGWELTREDIGTEIWSFATGDVVSSTPVVAGGVVYASAQKGQLYALRSGDGRKMWNHSAIPGATAVRGEIVYTGDLNISRYDIVALQADDGKELWTFPVGSSSANSPLAPVIAGGVVYAATDSGRVYALRASDGTEIWHFATRNTGAQCSGLAIVDGAVYLGGGDGLFHALDAADGREIWNFTQTGGQVAVMPTVTRGVVYVSANNGGVYALRVRDGHEIWAAATSGPFWTVVASNDIFVTTSDSLTTLRTSDGHQEWSFPTTHRFIQSAPVPTGRLVYVAVDDNVYALSVSSGRKEWVFKTGGYITSELVVASGVVYVGSFDHRLYALRASDGTEIWSFATGAQVSSEPAVTGGVAYLGSEDGNVYALRA